MRQAQGWDASVLANVCGSRGSKEGRSSCSRSILTQLTNNPRAWTQQPASVDAAGSVAGRDETYIRAW